MSTKENTLARHGFDFAKTQKLQAEIDARASLAMGCFRALVEAGASREDIDEAMAEVDFWSAKADELRIAEARERDKVEQQVCVR